MRRDQVLTVRLSKEEMALLFALRHVTFEDVSQAQMLVWALEELCRRVTDSDELDRSISSDGPAVCSAALEQLEKARSAIPWYAEPRGRPPRLTASERRAISALQKRPGEAATNT